MNRAVAALKAIFDDLDSTGRSGDEWAYEWMHETWPALVPLDLRVAVGDRDAAEDPLIVQAAFRVRCAGTCGGWLRRGRVTPRHWGDAYAELFLTEEAARQAALDAGWAGGLCPHDQRIKGDEDQ